MPPVSRAQLRALRWALAGYTVFVAVILGWRTPTTPVVDTLTVVSEQVEAIGASGWLTDPRIEFLANVALFVPFGLLLAAVLRRERWWWAAVLGFGYSLTAEVAQAILRPQRSGTVSDVVANTAGSLIGAGILMWIGTLLVSRAEQHHHAEHLGAVEHAPDADLGQSRVEQVGPMPG